MSENTEKILRSKLDGENLKKLMRIENPDLHEFVAGYVDLCGAEKVFVCTDDAKDIAHLKDLAIEAGEERKLKIDGHTIHFDHYNDQGRDKENTRLLISKKIDFGVGVNTMDRDEGLKEIHEVMNGIIIPGGTMYVLFFTLGPRGSDFSVPCLQMTDSAYVGHSDHLLYRTGYEEFVRLGKDAKFLKFVHSQGELEGAVCKNLDKRRIYIDLDGDTVYSANTQYGGNTIGLKKLAFRLTIQRADREGWLAEHMFVMGVHGPEGRVTCFTGAFPSLCGKTSTSMIKGETIIGDDLAYFKIVGDEVRTVNVEKGAFGIIPGVNSADDPIFWKTLHSPGDIIFSNVLYTEEGDVHWQGKDGEVPARGINHSGEWSPGLKDKKGKEIPVSHPNARFTLDLHSLENLDPELDNPEGVVLGGIIYGGRDSDTCPPVEESFDWAHGVVTKGASLESETTAATLGQEGVRKFNLMANLDFLSIPIGKYIQNHLDFGARLKKPPRIYGVNYFLLNKDGNFMNEKTDKGVWVKWMELRVHGEVDGIETPTGIIPNYDDLKGLFRKVLDRDYSKEDYIEQFTVRVPECLAKIDRIEDIYKNKVTGAPEAVLKILGEQRERLIKAKEKHGEYIPPELGSEL